MAQKMKTIGVLTSGGDAPGMNAAVRAVVLSAIHKGMKVIGIRNGYHGLLHDEMSELDAASVSNTIQNSGTELYTARCLEFKGQDGVDRGRQACLDKGIDGIVVIGGDGSFRGARDLSLTGIPCVGIPGTIDNDIASSEYTIGFDTAMNTVLEMVDRLRDTCTSHHRCSVVEVMGHHCGDIALQAGIASGATAILVPERPYDLQKDVIDKIAASKAAGKREFIIMVSEGMCDVHEMAKKIQEATGVETRATVLGHVQRGGAPTLRDRLIASQMGYHAVELLEEGIGNRVVVMQGGRIIDMDILEALSMKRDIDDQLLEIGKALAL